MGGAVVMGSWSKGVALREKLELSARLVPQGSVAKLGSKGSTLSVNKILQDEVEATIHMDKALGICFEGNSLGAMLMNGNDGAGLIESKEMERRGFWNVTSVLKLADKELYAIDLVAKSRSLKENEIRRRSEVRKEVWTLSRQNNNLLNLIEVDGVMHEDLCRVKQEFFKEIYDNGCLAKAINSFFITLIPKKDCSEGILDYRPMSLIGSIYKMLSKVLASRFKKVLPRIVGESQTAFVGGQNILDGVLISNEIVDWWKKKKQKGFILKLDFEKSYDSVNWECLNMLFQRAKEVGLIKGVVIGTRRISVTHLQFADNTIVFCEAGEHEILNVKRILRCFEVLPGLRINFHKSEVVTSKYNNSGGRWRRFLVDGIQCSRIWGDILSLECSSPNLFNFFMKNYVIKVENGRRISFWEDYWSSNCSFRDEFPRLFELSDDKDANLKQMIDRRNSSDGWIFRFRRGLRAWD
ncbi:uncharacterized protein LOC114293387 [Camellia sinensis]|uniref:uncharacterized protein LOC114293387 n=1 Tax=Camellia sinensis TaxID=4442 RepID=UPI00103662AF|nr:uncharacterized protein LOC114293387 [Camellia sinensis]